jgi:hypothetical protein
MIRSLNSHTSRIELAQSRTYHRYGKHDKRPMNNSLAFRSALEIIVETPYREDVAGLSDFLWLAGLFGLIRPSEGCIATLCLAISPFIDIFNSHWGFGEVV